MLYDYKCNKCGHEYEKSNPIVHRTMSGECPECGSKDTKKIMSMPKFKGFGSGGDTGWDGKGVMK